MKTRFFHFCVSIMKKIGILLAFISLGYACVPKDEVFKTFEGDMIYSFLAKDTAFAEYVKIVDKAGLKGMLSAYGEYTCLAPTNSAFKIYYKKISPNFNFDSLTTDQIQYLAKTHLIPSRYLTPDLQDGVIPKTNMNQRFIEIKFSTDSILSTLKVLLNSESRIILKDKQVYNGVIQGIDHVLKPSEAQLPELIASNPSISIFSEALQLTRLSDSLRLVEDKTYVRSTQYLDIYSKKPGPAPFARKYGYTALIEDNTLLAANGINNLEDLIAYANQKYPSDSQYATDYTNPNNSLNKFIAYHLYEKMVFQDKFLYKRSYVTGSPLDEFYETMYSNRIMKVEKDFGDTHGLGLIFNRGTDSQFGIKENMGKTTVNGVYHLVNQMVCYTNSVENMLQNSRIRFDLASLFPELTNNAMRCSETGVSGAGASDEWVIPPGYLKYLKTSNVTRFYYLCGTDAGWANYQGDEMMGVGNYDLTMRMLPVPPGTYEIRLGYSANTLRSVTQLYVDNKPIGIPLDLRILSDNPKIGYLADGVTDDNGYENDKMMRNRGYMKGPTSARYGTTPLRGYNGSLRRIIGTFTFDDYKPHTLRFRSVIENPGAQGMIDYVEYVPKSVYNPTSGEPELRE